VTITGKLIKQKRIDRGFTQSYLSVLLGMSSQHLSNVERGVSGLPVKYISNVCKSLKIKKSELKNTLIADYVQSLK